MLKVIKNLNQGKDPTYMIVYFIVLPAKVLKISLFNLLSTKI